MAAENGQFVFPNSTQYAFLYENAHLLMLSWDRDNARFLFLIKGTNDSGMVLDYPGQTFTDRVLDSIENIFFVQVQEEETGTTKRYVLGSYFECRGQLYGAYYERDRERPDVVLFRVEGEGPDRNLEVLDDAEYQIVAASFMEQHQDMMDIGRHASSEGNA